MSKELFMHGITTNTSNYIIFLVPFSLSFSLYIFDTPKLQKFIKENQLRKVNCEYSKGYLLPINTIPSSICKVREYSIPSNISKSDTDSQKGSKACKLVSESIKKNGYEVEEIPTNDPRQINFTDLVIKKEGKNNKNIEYRIEVKADLRAADTGNLYLETHSHNINKCY